MARGESGRIVIEVEPEVKRRLYSALALSGSTLKDWFVQTAVDYCREANQPGLFPKEPIRYKKAKPSALALNDKSEKT